MKQRLEAELVPITAALQRATEALPAPVRPVAAHIFDAGGKRLRPFLTVLLARLLGYAGEDIYELAVSMEMLHAATLLHDGARRPPIPASASPPPFWPETHCWPRPTGLWPATATRA